MADQIEHEAESKASTSLPLLQNHIKRDPAAYEAQFTLQFNHFMSVLDVFKLKPHRPSKEFTEMLMFIAQTSVCYSQVEETVKPKSSAARAEPCPPAEFGSTTDESALQLKGNRGGSIRARLGNHCAVFIDRLIDILLEHRDKLHSATRQAIVTALIMLRNKRQLTSERLLPVWFELFEVEDKNLRSGLLTHIVRDIARQYKTDRSSNVNKKLQDYLSAQTKSARPSRGRKALAILIELYRRGVWTDAKVVNTIATATLAADKKVCVGAATFLLGNKNQALIDVDSDGESDTQHKTAIGSKKSRGKQNKEARANATLERRAKRLAQRKADSNSDLSFTAIDLLYDAQALAEKLLGRVSGNKDNFNVRIVLLNLISRLVGRHQLILLNLYSYLQRYLNPRQKQVSQVLAVIAQATHDLVPPQELEPIVRTLTHEFISDHQSADVIAMGLNSIRELAYRSPLIISKDQLMDLAEFRSHKDKGVVMACKSLINLFRDLYPSLLHRRLRGKTAALTVHNKQDEQPVYGQTKTIDYIHKAEVLLSKNSVEKEKDADSAVSGIGSSGEASEGDSTDIDTCELIDEEDLLETEDSDGEEEYGEQDAEETSCETRDLQVKDQSSVKQLGYLAMMSRVWDSDDFAALKRAQTQSSISLEEGEMAAEYVDESGGENASDAEGKALANRLDIVDPGTIASKKRSRNKELDGSNATDLGNARKSARQERMSKGILKHGAHGTGLGHSKPTRVQSRNKPMIMQKQSRKLSHKRQTDARTKLSNIRKHIKNLKKKTGKKVRRRRK